MMFEHPRNAGIAIVSLATISLFSSCTQNGEKAEQLVKEENNRAVARIVLGDDAPEMQSRLNISRNPLESCRAALRACAEIDRLTQYSGTTAEDRNPKLYREEHAATKEAIEQTLDSTYDTLLRALGDARYDAIREEIGDACKSLKVVSCLVKSGELRQFKQGVTNSYSSASTKSELYELQATLDIVIQALDKVGN